MNDKLINELMGIYHQDHPVLYDELPTGYELWVCPECKQRPNFSGIATEVARWRWNGDTWEHYHASLGYVVCTIDKGE